MTDLLVVVGADFRKRPLSNGAWANCTAATSVADARNGARARCGGAYAQISRPQCPASVVDEREGQVCRCTRGQTCKRRQVTRCGMCRKRLRHLLTKYSRCWRWDNPKAQSICKIARAAEGTVRVATAVRYVGVVVPCRPRDEVEPQSRVGSVRHRHVSIQRMGKGGKHTCD